MALKQFLKLVTPPLVERVYHSLRDGTGIGLTGDYRSWDEAVRHSTGYDSEVILEKTKQALLKVKRGEAAFERDSVLFDEIQYSWPLLAGLMWAAAKANGRLNVLDFGGSLGSTYFQNKNFLTHLPEVRWNIVEQARHVAAGQEAFADDTLKFYHTVPDCLAENQPNVVILAGVMPYLERPYDLLDMLSNIACDHLFIDRTLFWDGDTDWLSVQKVPARIYRASYPCWILSDSQFRSKMNRTWETVAVVSEWGPVAAPIKAAWKGMLLRRKQVA